MRLTLAVNKSEKNRITKEIEVLQTIEFTFKSPTSFMDPSLILSGLTADTLARCNYFIIDELHRRYFVTELKSLRNDLFQISGHVDVLSTYDAQIRAQTAVIARQEKVFNLYLDDKSYRVYQNPQIITKQFPAGFNTQSYVLAIAGG